MGSGGKKGGGGIPVVQYYMSIGYGICAGEVESLWQVKINEKSAWIGPQQETGIFEIDNDELFGGIKKEGGVKGRVCFQAGDFTQLLDDEAAAKHGLTSTTAPAYRGISTAYFIEPEDADNPGFYWSANQPYVPAAAFRVSRLDRSWEPDFAEVGTVTVTAWQNFKEAVIADPDEWDDSLVIFNNWTRIYHNEFEYLATPAMYPLESDFNTCDASHTAWGHGGIDGIQIRAARGSYDVSSFYPGEVEICETPGASPGELFYVECEEAPGRLFAFEILAVDYSFNGVIGIGHQAGFGWSARFLGYEIAALPGEEAEYVEGELPQIDANPAHIIRECITNPLWGLGLPSTVLDDDSFAAAAEALWFEEFGLSMIWTRQTPVQDFVREVQDHINAMVFVRPSTGLYELKLIRDDYDPGDLPEFDASNATLVSFSRRSPSEVVNEIQLTWTNPATESEEVYTLQDLGSIVANGGEIVSDNRNYYGVRNRALAGRLAARDISTATAPLASGELLVDRTGFDLAPGDVLKLTWPTVATNTLVMRIMGVNYGRPGDSKISLSLTEDIFAYVRPEPIDPMDTEAEALTQAPAPPDPLEVISLPHFFVALAGVTLDTDEAAVGVIAASDVLDTDSVELYGEITNVAGSTALARLATRSIVAQAQIAEAWEFEPETEASPFLNYTAGAGPVAGGFGIVGPEGLAEDEHEIVVFIEKTAGVWTVRRGALDTVPRAWPIYTPIRFLSTGARVDDPRKRPVGIEVDYRVKCRTSRGLSAGTDISYEPTYRYQAPLRPADCKVEGVASGTYNGASGADIGVTWANRNRLTEETIVLAWDAATVTAEASATTTLTLIDDDDDSVITTITGLTGTSHTIPFVDFGGAQNGRVRFTSERDGIESIQGHEISVLLLAGYGESYDSSYGA